MNSPHFSHSPVALRPGALFFKQVYFRAAMEVSKPSRRAAMDGKVCCELSLDRRHCLNSPCLAHISPVAADKQDNYAGEGHERT
jgi:hypothetical protein